MAGLELSLAAAVMRLLEVQQTLTAQRDMLLSLLRLPPGQRPQLPPAPPLPLPLLTQQPLAAVPQLPQSAFGLAAPQLPQSAFGLAAQHLPPLQQLQSAFAAHPASMLPPPAAHQQPTATGQPHSPWDAPPAVDEAE